MEKGWGGGRSGVESGGAGGRGENLDTEGLPGEREPSGCRLGVRGERLDVAGEDEGEGMEGRREGLGSGGRKR